MIALLLVLLSAPTPVTVTDACETPACHYLVREVEHHIQNNPATTLTTLQYAHVEVVIKSSRSLSRGDFEVAAVAWLVHMDHVAVPLHSQFSPLALHPRAVPAAAAMIMRSVVEIHVHIQ